MNRFKYILPLAIAICIYSACEQEIDWKTGSSDPLLIVDAILTNENISHEIKICKSTAKLNQEPEPVSGALIRIWDGSTLHTFIESDIKGTYKSEPFIAVTNRIYYLLIEAGDVRDTAWAAMAPLSPLRDYDFSDKEELYKYNDPGSDLPAMTEVYYDWSHSTDYCDEYGACKATEVYYTLDIVDISREFAPEKQQILFPSGTKLKRKKYSLSDQHQDFVRGLLLETEWRGGLFDTEHGNVPTNFRNGVRGWFGVCQVEVDSTVVP